MTRNILESDKVDSKIFEGRVLTLLGEVLEKINSQTRFLEEKFFLPSEVSKENRAEMDTELAEGDDEWDD